MQDARGPIANIYDVPTVDVSYGDGYRARDGAISHDLGARHIGTSVAFVPPGKRAYPFHCHHLNEEMFFVVSGTGMLRFGASTYAVRPGDVIVAPPGGPEVAHQLVNTGEEDLVYLMVSTLYPAEIVEYPDAGTVSITGADVTAAGAPTFRFRGRLGERTLYWDGEDPAPAMP